MRKKQKHYITVTEEQIRQAALELERQENMDLEQVIAEANAWAEANHIVRRPFPEVPPKKRPVRQSFRPRRDTSIKIAKKSRFKPYVQLAAVFLIVLFGGWYTQTDSVQGMRLDLVNLFTKEVRDKGTIELNGQSEWDGFYVPEYLPNELKLFDNQITTKISTQKYKDNEQWIHLMQYKHFTSHIYNDKQTRELLVKDKYTAYLYVQNDVWSIVWYDDHGVFVEVIGNIDLQEGLSFINNLKWSQS